MSPDEINKIITQSHQAFLSWKDLEFSQRAKHLKNVTNVLRDNAMEYAKLMASEMGKPITAGKLKLKNVLGVVILFSECWGFYNQKLLPLMLLKAS
jgi:succinate-semialdehyde dehydrogenase/glutarate-semialdehyde dehydrogenase